MSKIEIRSYEKVIKKRAVLNDINYNFEEGKIYGLYGKNGSGKTMILRAIAGLIYPSKGEIIIDGKVLHKDISFPDSVGIIIENTGLPLSYTGYDNLKMLGKIKGIATDEDIIQSLEAVGLDPKDKRKVRAYSLGMKQKLAIAQAIFEKPEILLLDEPTIALDSEGIRLLKEILRKFKENGATIILASHDKEDLEMLCDSILRIEDGRIVS